MKPATTSSVVHEHEQGIAADLVSARGGYRGMEEDVRRELREDSPCGLASVPDSDITVTYTVRPEDGYHLYRASVPCVEPRCVTFARENQWVLALHRRLDAGDRDMAHDPLERAFSEFEGVYWWAARHPTPERLERVAHWRSELARLVATRFPDLPAPAPAEATDGDRSR